MEMGAYDVLLRHAQRHQHELASGNLDLCGEAIQAGRVERDDATVEVCHPTAIDWQSLEDFFRSMPTDYSDVVALRRFEESLHQINAGRTPFRGTSVCHPREKKDGGPVRDEHVNVNQQTSVLMFVKHAP